MSTPETRNASRDTAAALGVVEFAVRAFIARKVSQFLRTGYAPVIMLLAAFAVIIIASSAIDSITL